MISHERKRLEEIIKGMSEEEHQLVAELLPVKYILDRIHKEIQEKEFLLNQMENLGLSARRYVDDSTNTTSHGAFPWKDYP